MTERHLDFGVFQMPELRPERNWNLYVREMVEEAVLAEKLGFTEYYVGEHHRAGHETAPMPELQLARIAERTHTIKIGTGILCLPQQPHNDPFSVAERMAFLDQVSRGRVIFGYGAGALPPDMEMFGVDEDNYKDVMWEAIDVIETYLHAEEPTDYHGDHFEYEDHMIQLGPYQEDPMSAFAGLASKGSFTGAVKGGHKPLAIGFAPLESTNPAAQSLKDVAGHLDEAAKEIGRDPEAVRDEWGIVREVYVAESKQRALDDIRKGVEENYDYYFNLGDGGLVDLAATEPDMTREEMTVEWMAENFPFIVGSPEDCIKQIKRLYDEVGGFGQLIVNAHDWYLPRSRWENSLRLLAEEVMPEFQSHLGPREHDKRMVPSYDGPPEPDEDVFKVTSSSGHRPPSTADDD